MLPLDCIFGWPSGLISELKVHASAVARKASDHLPLTARVNLSAKIPEHQKAA
jgi:endonuclease/exonuclease/phosphatase family metal-dependent hydrolase